MSFTYVIPDIHGRMDLLDEALDLVEQRDGGTVIFLGDYIDRGLASAKVVARVMAGPTSPNFTWVPIRGNHEDMLLQALEEPRDLQIWQWWHGNGGDTTMVSYAGVVPADHISWMNALPRLVQDTHRVYVHAGVDESYAFEDQPQQVTQWFRYPSKANVGYRDQHVVHGHTPQTDGPELYANRTNLDCGAFFTGKLVVGVFDDDIAGGPIELITVGATDVDM